MKYDIGDILEDEDGNLGHVVINWDEGSSPIENNAAHPNPTIVGQWPDAPLTSSSSGAAGCCAQNENKELGHWLAL